MQPIERHLLALVALPLISSLGATQETSAEKPSEKSAVVTCERSVDDYLADIAESKKKQRNRSLLPNGVCIGGWCKDIGVPTNHPPKETKPSRTEQPTSAPVEKGPTPPPGESSSKRPVEEIAIPDNNDTAECNPEQAAQDVEVGDYYFSQKSYKPALNRYRLALDNKPNDPAIHLRLGRTYEKLKDPQVAIENFQAVIDLSDPQSPRAKEARTALDRLQAALKKK